MAAAPRNRVVVLRAAADEPEGPIDEFIGRCKAESVDDGPFRHHTLDLDTRYYAAQLNVVVGEFPPFDSSSIDTKQGADQTLMLGEALCNVLTGCNALFVSAGTGDQASWQRALNVLISVNQLDGSGPVVKAVVVRACTVTADVDANQTPADVRDTLFDLETEVVRAPPVITVQTETDDWTLRERHGADRLIEMLESHMWDDMHMKGRSDKRNNPSASVDEFDDGLNTSGSLPSEDVPDLSHLADIFKAAMMGADKHGGEPGSEGEAEVEEEMDGFVRALGELRNLQALGQTLPNEQRHDLATRVAASVLQFMDGSDEFDDL